MVNRVQVGSDHRMVRARIRVKFQQEWRKLFCSKPRMLKIDISKKNEYLEELNRAFSQSEFDENNPDLDMIQRAIPDSLMGTAKKFKLKRPSTPTKFSDVTLQLRKKKKGTQNSINYKREDGICGAFQNNQEKAEIRYQ